MHYGSWLTASVAPIVSKVKIWRTNSPANWLSHIGSGTQGCAESTEWSGVRTTQMGPSVGAQHMSILGVVFLWGPSCHFTPAMYSS